MAKFDARAKKDLIAEGYIVGKCEYWNQFSRRSIDLFGIFDYICVGKGRTIGVQITSKSNMAARRKKIRESEVYESWLEANNEIMLRGYFKKGHRYQYKTEYVS